MRVLVSAGDRVLIEQTIYTTNIQVLSAYQARMTSVAPSLFPFHCAR